jgi:hypothetical protein
MAGFRSSSDRDGGVRSGPAHGSAYNQARLGRADSHAGPHAGGRGWTPVSLRNRADQGLGASTRPPEPSRGPRPAVGQPVKPPGPEVR